MPAADEMTKGRPQYYGIEPKIPQMLLKPTCLKVSEGRICIELSFRPIQCRSFILRSV